MTNERIQGILRAAMTLSSSRFDPAAIRLKLTEVLHYREHEIDQVVHTLKYMDLSLSDPITAMGKEFLKAQKSSRETD